MRRASNKNNCDATIMCLFVHTNERSIFGHSKCVSTQRKTGAKMVSGLQLKTTTTKMIESVVVCIWDPSSHCTCTQVFIQCRCTQPSALYLIMVTLLCLCIKAQTRKAQHILDTRCCVLSSHGSGASLLLSGQDDG